MSPNLAELLAALPAAEDDHDERLDAAVLQRLFARLGRRPPPSGALQRPSACSRCSTACGRAWTCGRSAWKRPGPPVRR